MLTAPSLPPPHRRLCPASADGGRAAGFGGVAANDNIARLRAVSTRNLGAIAVALVAASYRAIRACRLGQSEHPDRRALRQENPRVGIVVSPAYPLSVQVSHRGLRLIEVHRTPIGAKAACTASAEIVHRSHAR